MSEAVQAASVVVEAPTVVDVSPAPLELPLEQAEGDVKRQLSEKRNAVVCTARGRDQPGIANAFMAIAVDHQCQVVDLAQFLIEGSLVFTFVVDVPEQASMKFMKELRHRAKAWDLELDFHFPECSEYDERDNFKEALLILLTSTPITPSLLRSVDGVLAESGCVVREIEHRSDNKKENNGEYNKLQMRISCPDGLALPTLYMGAPTEEGSTVGLQQVARDHGAHIVIQWYDGLNRPNCKSLVVFELSYVLCPFNVLDEVLKEAGVDPSAASATSSLWAQNNEKVHMLKGASTEVVRKVIDRLEFTKGAKLLCSALKAMGFRLAMLTNSGVGELADTVKWQLGLDYVICQQLKVEDGRFTGEYAGEVQDVRFQKSDLMNLMADREGIDRRNVIMIGDFLKGLSSSNARGLLETFGPCIRFTAQDAAAGSLSAALYLLGFNGRHVAELRQRFEQPKGPRMKLPPTASVANLADLAAAVADDGDSADVGTRYFISLSAGSREPGQLRRVFEPLVGFGGPEGGVTVATCRQCSLQDGGMCLGLDLQVKAPNPEQAVKDLLFACQSGGLQVRWEQPSAESSVHRTPISCWKHYLENRHVITLVQKPQIAGPTLKAVLDSCAEKEVNIVKIERLSVTGLAALQITVSLPEGMEPRGPGGYAEELVQIASSRGADLAFQRDDVERWMRRLIIFDMDSTLIQQEVIDELARIAGVEAEVSAITEAAMSGELNFLESLKSRVALLKGHNSKELFGEVKKNLIYTPGAKKLCSTLKKMGYKMAVISGGFLPCAQEVQRHLGLDYAFANTLEVDERTGNLTGVTTGPVVTPQRKRALLAMIASIEGCQIEQTIAVGDGANDIPMLHTAGLGVAFCAKPKVQAVTEVKINQKDLSSVLYLIGLSEHATMHLQEQLELDAVTPSARTTTRLVTEGDMLG